jgi:hypothetical protein
MALETDIRRGPRLPPREDERQFRWVYAVIFAISFVPAVLARLTPWRRGGGQEQRSIIAEVKARTSRIVPFFFMG